MSRLLAFGDIHGYRTKLCDLMEKVQPTQYDKIIFLGDYIDRGKECPGTIDFLIAFYKEFPKTVFLAGNHDHLFVSMMMDNERLPWPPINASGKAVQYKSIGDVQPFDQDFKTLFYANGGRSTLLQYKTLMDIPDEHVRFFANLKLFHEETVDAQVFFFVHAGIQPGVALEEQTARDLLWITDWDTPRGSDFGFEGKVIVRGHTHYVPVPGIEPYLINVDTGVYRNSQEDYGMGVITCCNVVTREIWQA